MIYCYCFRLRLNFLTKCWIMSHEFNLNFKTSWITRIGFKLVPDAVNSFRQKSNPVMRKCYEFEFLNWKERCPEKVQVAPIELKKNKWLFGPATKLSTRSIVYPCSREKCALPCPCLICHKKHPHCRAVNDCDCEECKLFNVDHDNYHGCLHIGCKSCDSLIDSVGVYKFGSIDKNIKTGIFREGFQKISRTKNHFLLDWKLFWPKIYF